MREFIDRYFNINLKDYSNIGIDLNISLVLLFFFVGLCAAAMVVNHHRSYMATAVKQLIRHGADGEANAKTIGELGLGQIRSIRRALSRDGQLTKKVKRVGEERLTYEEYVALKKAKKLPKAEKIDFDTARFYISPDQKERAKSFYENNSSSVLKAILLCVLIMAVYFCLMLIMPGALKLLNGILGNM